MTTATSENLLLHTASCQPRTANPDVAATRAAGGLEGAASAGTVKPLALQEELGQVGLLFATAEETAAFNAELAARLRAIGVDANRPVSLYVDGMGNVKAAEGEPRKGSIDSLFAADPAFANQFRKISNTEELKAVAQEYEAYQAAYGAARGDVARTNVWREYSAYIAAIGASYGKLTFVNGRLQPTLA